MKETLILHFKHIKIPDSLVSQSTLYGNRSPELVVEFAQAKMNILRQKYVKKLKLLYALSVM